MAMPEIHYGILPDTGGTQLMTALIGPSRTKYMVMTGERIDAQTALDHADRRTTQRYLDPRLSRETKPSDILAAYLANPRPAAASPTPSQKTG
jgi:enoyl-CoA hydratase/carnithine racemase